MAEVQSSPYAKTQRLEIIWKVWATEQNKWGTGEAAEANEVGKKNWEDGDAKHPNHVLYERRGL